MIELKIVVMVEYEASDINRAYEAGVVAMLEECLASSDIVTFNVEIDET